MKVNEVISPKQPAQVQPSLTQQQQRVGKVLQQRIASDQQQPATEMDKVMAMRQYAKWKKQADHLYRERLKQQLAAASRGIG